MSNYWESIAQKRIGRRHALVGGSLAGAGIVAAALVGCSSGSNADKKPQTRIAEPRDTSGAAKRGGVYQSTVNGDPSNLDPMTTLQLVGGPGAAAYSTLTQEKMAPGGTKVTEFEGDLVENWEFLDGGMVVNMRLRPDARFDSRPPTNGRTVDADDVLYTWRTFTSVSKDRGLLYHATDPGSGVDAIEKVDARTVRLKMAFPWSSLMPALSQGYFAIMPREAEKDFNPKNETRGSGPWTLTEYQPSASLSWKRNSNWYRKDIPFLDGFETPIVSEYAQLLAQFKAKRIWDVRPKPTDVLTLSAEAPEALTYYSDLGNLAPAVSFSTRPDSPFLDNRVRRAFSMAIDRAQYSEVMTEASTFNQQGLPMEIMLNSHLSAYWTGYWTDPSGKGLGEGAKYFSHDVAEAKKLLAAAGHQSGFELAGHYTTRYADMEKRVSILAGMLVEAGIRIRPQLDDYQTTFLALIYSQGNHDGIQFNEVGAISDPMLTLSRWFTAEAANTRALPPDSDQRQIEDRIRQGLRELDTNKYLGLVQEVQRLLALHQPTVSYSFQARQFEFVQPWVQNWLAIRKSRGGTGLLNVWIDETKKT